MNEILVNWNCWYLKVKQLSFIRNECRETEQKASKKRDEVNAEMTELNKKLGEITEQKKEKSKENKKIYKLVF